MSQACSGTQAYDRFGITLDFVIKLHNGSISDEEAKRFLRREDPFRPMPAEKVSFLSVVATTNLGAVGGKKTKKCFPKPRYGYRAGDFDNWLPAKQPKADACAIATLAPSRGWTFAESAAAILGIGAGTDIVLLGNLLIEHGHTITLVQAEEMVEVTEREKKTGMRTDGYGNFFFVETGNPENPVSVGCVDRDSHVWNAYVFSLADGYRGNADYRLLVRNLSDTSKL